MPKRKAMDCLLPKTVLQYIIGFLCTDVCLSTMNFHKTQCIPFHWHMFRLVNKMWKILMDSLLPLMAFFISERVFAKREFIRSIPRTLVLNIGHHDHKVDTWKDIGSFSNVQQLFLFDFSEFTPIVNWQEVTNLTSLLLVNVYIPRVVNLPSSLTYLHISKSLGFPLDVHATQLPLLQHLEILSTEAIYGTFSNCEQLHIDLARVSLSCTMFPAVKKLTLECYQVDDVVWNKFPIVEELTLLYSNSPIIPPTSVTSLHLQHFYGNVHSLLLLSHLTHIELEGKVIKSVIDAT
jgi:hypothetical protein